MNPLGPFGTGFTDRGACLNALNSRIFKYLVPAARFELAHSYERQILSLLCLPFHHTGSIFVVCIDSSLNFVARKRAQTNSDYYKSDQFDNFDHNFNW